jgi:hypothetical protein
MDKLEHLQSQKLITEAQIKALDRMRVASAFEWMIALKAGLAEIERQIDEIMGGDIL